MNGILRDNEKKMVKTHTTGVKGIPNLDTRTLDTSVCFVTRPVFTAISCQHLAQLPSWRTTPCRPSETAYSVYSQIPSILETVPPRTRRAVATGGYLSSIQLWGTF